MMKRRFRKKNHGSQPDKRFINPLKHIYDSSGANSRMRGNALQLHEKYMGLAREALGNGDRILMEHYFQYAEHYQRLINQYQETMDNRNRDFGPSSQDSSSDSPSRNSPSTDEFDDRPPRKMHQRSPADREPRESNREPNRESRGGRRPSSYDDYDDFDAPPRPPQNRRSNARGDDRDMNRDTDRDVDREESGSPLPLPGAINTLPARASDDNGEERVRKVAKAKGRPRKAPARSDDFAGDDAPNNASDSEDDIF